METLQSGGNRKSVQGILTLNMKGRDLDHVGPALIHEKNLSTLYGIVYIICIYIMRFGMRNISQ